MKKIPYCKIVFLCTALSVGINASAQKDPMKFGKINPDDLRMRVYEKDTSVGAVVLCDFGKSYFTYSDQNGFQLKFEHHTRIKILNKNGFDWANVTIPLYHDKSATEKLTSLKASTFNLVNGKTEEHQVKKDAIFEEEMSSNKDAKKFTFPDVREGSVIEYEYTVLSDFLFNLQEWKFQSSIPVIWSEYFVRIPEYFYYNLSVKGFEPFYINETTKVNESFSYVTHTSATEYPSAISSTQSNSVNVLSNQYHWVAKDVPALTEESYMTTIDNYLTQVEFELSSIQYPNSYRKDYTQTWESIDKLLLEDEDFGIQLNRKGFLSDDVASRTSQLSQPKDKMKALYDYARMHYKWNGKNSKFATTNIKDAYEKRAGNVADINLALVVMMRDAGLDADPVILSTRSNGIVHPAHPSLNKFNYVIAAVTINDTTYLLDASDPFCPVNMLPYRCLNYEGHLVSETNAKAIPLKATFPFKETTMAGLAFNTDGTLTGHYTAKEEGYAAVDLRKEIQNETSTKKYIDGLQQDNPGLELTKYGFENATDVYAPATFDFDFTTSGGAQNLGNHIYLNPMFIDQIKKNPFTQEERKFPIDFGYPIDVTNIVEIEIPEGYEVDESPENAIISLPGNAGKFIYNVTRIGNKYKIISKYSITKTIFLPEEYAAVKEFFNQIVNKQSQPVVLIKKS